MVHSWKKYIFKGFVAGIFSFIFFSSLNAYQNVEGIQSYPKSLHASIQRKQFLYEDISRFNSADNLWDILRQEFCLPHYENNPYVQEQINWIMAHQDFIIRSAYRAAPYLYYILQQVRIRHLPAELALLPMFESSYNPFAYSSAGAAGIWQMMPNTASGYGIKQNWWYDGRRDVVASTKAALNYLVYLGNFFNGNWLLSIAAYNTGEGSVLAAIRKNIRWGYNTDFWYLPLSRDTREYVPRLLALATIIANPRKYPVPFPFTRNAPYLAEVDVGGQIDLKQAANIAGLTHQQLIQLNPGFNHTATDPNGPYRLVLPIENVEQFIENLAQNKPVQNIHWIRYKVKHGDTLKTIARRFHTTPEIIRNTNLALANKLRRGLSLMIPKSGQAIPLVKTPPIHSVSNEVIETTIPTFADSGNVDQNPTVLQSGDTIYMVRPGDDLEKIARNFAIPKKIIEDANHLSNVTVLAEGKKLLIPTHSVNNDNAKLYNISPGDTIYMVRKGDTLEKIALKYHTSTASIRLSNLLASTNLQEGDRLVIPTHEIG